MLVTETRGGRALKSVQNREDYLTSAIFGHLRYLPPKLFWPGLFQSAKLHEASSTLHDFLVMHDLDLSEYDSLDVNFWPKKGDKIGRPDLVLDFKGKGVRSLQVVVEVKLWARRSGDQLVHYFDLLTRKRSTVAALIYLTPQDDQCRKDLTDALGKHGRPEMVRDRVFRLHWYDLAKVARAERNNVPHPYGMILGDIAKFLHRWDHATGLVDDRAKTRAGTTRSGKARQRGIVGSRGAPTVVHSEDTAFVINVLNW